MAAPPRRATDKWSRTYIFPGHYLPSLSELCTSLERTGWEIGDAEVLRYHYAHTLQEWYRRTCQHEAEITSLYDARMFRMWQFYLVGVEQGFRGAALVNFHMQSVKRRDALPMTRDYIQEEAGAPFSGRAGTGLASGALGGGVISPDRPRSWLAS